MQSLWSRAGQARHCGCRTCNQVLQGVGRRATTGVRRRKATFAEIFTACYSSMFASAALIDAIRKEDRKQDLDRQLDEARRDLAALKLQATSHALNNSRKLPIDLDATLLDENQMDSLYQNIRSFCKSRPFMKEIKNPAEPSASDLIASLQREYYGCPDGAIVDELGRIDYDALERALVAEQADETIPIRELQTDKHIDNRTRKSMGLIKALMRAADEIDDSVAPSPSLRKVQGLLVESPTPRYTFPGVNREHSTSTMASLHRTISPILATQGISLKEKIGRVCYNLLVCPYPPDIHTYNTLMVAFDKAGLHTLSENVAYSFLYRQRMSPTPLTYVALLNHYKESGLVGGFLHTMAVLAGGDRVYGAKLRRRHIEAVVADPKLYDWAGNTKKRTVLGEWVYEHVPLQRAHAEVLVHGLLHFKLFDAAAAFFVTCMQSGVTLGTRATRNLLDCIIQALDWRAAVRLIRELADGEEIWNGMLAGADADTISYFIERIYVLLDMSGIYRPGRQPSETILDGAKMSVRKLYSFLLALEEARPLEKSALMSSSRLRGPRLLMYDPMSAAKSRLLQIESLWKELVVARSTTISLERKLIRVKLSPGTSEDLALYVGKAAVEQSLRLSREFTELVGHAPQDAESRLAGQDAIEQQTERGGLEGNDSVEWAYDMGVFVVDGLKSHVHQHSKPMDMREDYLERKPTKTLGWLDQWEASNEEEVKYPQFESKLPPDQFFWEGRG